MKLKHLLWVYGLFFLFFLQLLSEFIESIYVFGLLSTGVTFEIVSIVLLFSPIVLLAFRKGLSRTVYHPGCRGACMPLACGRALTFAKDGDQRCGCWVLAGAFFQAGYGPWTQSMGDKAQITWDAHAQTIGVGLVTGLLMSTLLRMLGAGF